MFTTRLASGVPQIQNSPGPLGTWQHPSQQPSSQSRRAKPLGNRPATPSHWIAAFTLIIFTSFAAACSGGSRMTVAEYARWCGDNQLDNSEETEPATWGDFEERTEEALDAYARIRDQIPTELEDYFGTGEGLLRTLHDFAQLRDRDAAFNAFELLVPALAAASSIEAAEAALAPNTRAVLIDTGCIDEQLATVEVEQQQNDQPTVAEVEQQQDAQPAATKVEQAHTYTHTLMLNRGAWSCYFGIGDKGSIDARRVRRDWTWSMVISGLEDTRVTQVPPERTFIGDNLIILSGEFDSGYWLSFSLAQAAELEVVLEILRDNGEIFDVADIKDFAGITSPRLKWDLPIGRACKMGGISS